jgi:hypothetical protein
MLTSHLVAPLAISAAVILVCAVPGVVDWCRHRKVDGRTDPGLPPAHGDERTTVMEPPPPLEENEAEHRPTGSSVASDAFTREELYDLARRYSISNHATMTTSALVEAVRSAMAAAQVLIDRDLARLESLTRDQLAGIAQRYGIACASTMPNRALVEAIAAAMRAEVAEMDCARPNEPLS